MIEKWLDPSMKLIFELQNIEYCKMFGIPFVEQRDISVSKGGNQFKFAFYTEISEYQQINNAKSKNLEELGLSINDNVYIVPKGALITSFKDNFTEKLAFSCEISTQSIYSRDIVLDQEYFYRYIIPIGNADINYRDFHSYRFDLYFQDKKTAPIDLLKVFSNNKEYHFWKTKIQDINYLIIDSTQTCNFNEIDKISLSILVSYGFLSGVIHLSEAYIIASNEPFFQNPKGLYYKGLRNTIKGQYTIFTTNAYSVLVPIAKNICPEDGETRVIEIIKKKWVNKIDCFNEKVFSSLVEIINNYEAICRAAMMTVEASKFSIDIQLATYCVAFETICKIIMKKCDLKPPTVIQKDIWDTILKPQFDHTINKLRGENILNKEQLEFIQNKVNSFNQPTNKDTLMQPFIKLGYNLSQRELECIKYRNLSLHGILPVKEHEDEIDKLFYTNLVMHKLCCVLILKLVGFDGYIINNVKLYEQNIKKKINECGFLKI